MLRGTGACVRATCSTLCGKCLCGDKCATRQTCRLTGTSLFPGLNCRICAVPSKRCLVNQGNGLGPCTALKCDSNSCCCAPSG